ncbi:MAG TPA: hypothetical protein VEK07_22615 [Polyangiaceae bacterium]|nr:hypothetical protein [Polyangiaceae bacterium]
MRFAAAIGWALVPLATAWGQTVDVERPSLLVVGTPSLRTASAALNDAPPGASATRLPSGRLRIGWRASLGMSVEHAPVLDAQGNIYVVGERGDVVALSPTGEELWRLATNFAQPGPSTVLRDGTIVFVDGSGAAVAVREGFLRWRTKLARGDSARPHPLALDDGGVIVAAGNAIVVLDAEGHERARLVLSETAASILAAEPNQIAVVTTNGTVWTWNPGALEPTRVASLDASIDATPALGNGHVLFAIAAGGSRLFAADLVTGSVSLRASATGSLWVSSPVVQRETVSLLALAAGGEVALALDGRGGEIGQAWIGSSPLPVMDGGVGLRSAIPQAPLLADSEGTLAFAAADGALGVVAHLGSSQPEVQRISDPCPAPAGGRAAIDSAVVGITPLRPGAFLAVCRRGTLLAIQGESPGIDGVGGVGHE